VGALGTSPSSEPRRSAMAGRDPIEDLPAVRKPRLRTGVVIPCYRVSAQILGVLEQIGPTVERIYVVDDACPEKTGALVRDSCHDPRVHVIFNPKNAGVGGAVIEGYKAALRDGMDIIVKLDGDGQMDPVLIPDLVGPIADGEADYTKGTASTASIESARCLDCESWAMRCSH